MVKYITIGGFMAEVLLAVDFGGTYTSIYKKGDGFVLKEPTLICAVKTEDGYDIKAMGIKAKEIQGKTDNRTVVFSPILDGTIKSNEYATLLLKYFLDKVLPKKRVFCKIKCLVPCPVGITQEEKEQYKTVFLEAGVSEVIFVPRILCSAYGGGVNIFANNAHIVVDGGGMSTDIGVINMCSIIEGATLGLGAKAIDSELVKFVALKYNVEIGLSTAQKIKEEIGSLYNSDTANMEVSGIDTRTKAPATVVVYATDVKMAILPLITEVIRTIETTLNILPPEISADVAKNGIVMTGGLATISGLEKYLKKELNIGIIIADEAINACIIGAGKLLSNIKELKQVLVEV